MFVCLAPESFAPKDSPKPPVGGNQERYFHDEKLGNKIHDSATDPEARLYKKGQKEDPRMSYLGHALMENRNSLIIGCAITRATGRAGGLQNGTSMGKK